MPSKASKTEDSFLKELGVSAKKREYRDHNGTQQFYVNVGYYITTKARGTKARGTEARGTEARRAYYEWSPSVDEYKLVVETLKTLYSQSGHAHPATFLSDIGKDRLHAMFLAICLETKRDELPGAIAAVRDTLAAQKINNRKQDFVQGLYSHPAHTFVGKLALWCLLRPFA